MRAYAYDSLGKTNHEQLSKMLASLCDNSVCCLLMTHGNEK